MYEDNELTHSPRGIKVLVYLRFLSLSHTHTLSLSLSRVVSTQFIESFLTCPRLANLVRETTFSFPCVHDSRGICVPPELVHVVVVVVVVVCVVLKMYGRYMKVFQTSPTGVRGETAMCRIWLHFCRVPLSISSHLPSRHIHAHIHTHNILNLIRHVKHEFANLSGR